MIRSLNTCTGIEFSATCEINLNVLNKIFGADIANSDDAWAFHYIKLVQRKKHRKYRINKKWAKRYGFREEVKSLGKYQIENTNVEGDMTTITMNQQV